MKKTIEQKIKKEINKNEKYLYEDKKESSQILEIRFHNFCIKYGINSNTTIDRMKHNFMEYIENDTNQSNKK